MKVQLEFECGDTTCAIGPGKLCRFAQTTRYGTLYVCGVFGSELVDSNGDPYGDGWLQRLPECLALSEVKK